MKQQELQADDEEERRKKEDYQKLFENMERVEIEDQPEQDRQELSKFNKIYRTYEWKLKEVSEAQVQNFFEFTDALGEGRKILIRATHNREGDSDGTNTIIVGDWSFEFQRSLIDLEQQPEPFSFRLPDCVMAAELSANTETDQLTLKVMDTPY